MVKPRIKTFLSRNRLLYRLYLRRISVRQFINILKILLLRITRKKNYPLSILLALTDKCQCACKHCGVDRKEIYPGSSILSFAEICKLIDELFSLGVANITFVGGEPLLREDLFKIIKFANLKGLFTTLDSNGLLLSKENVKKLKASGLTLIKISLDSANSLVHDQNRGVAGCFEKATSAIRYCASEGIPCIVTTVATKELVSGKGIEDIIILAKDLGALALQLEFLAYSGKLLKRKYNALSREEIGYIRGLCDYSYVYHSSVFSDFSRCSCLSRLNCYISPFGEVKICMFLPGKAGNIRNKDFKIIWEEMSGHPHYDFSSIDCYSEKKS